MDHRPDLMIPGPFTGARLRELREQRGLSRQELAQKTQPALSRAYIYLLEGTGDDDGVRRPSYDVVLRLAKALEVSPDAFAESKTVIEFKKSSVAEQPQGLREAAQRFKIPAADVQQLAHFAFRGRRPQSAADWAHLWMAILKSVGVEL